MLNWLTRYAVLVDDLGPGRPSVLDVGCGPVGLYSVLPDLPFAGQDIAFPGRVADTMFAVRTAPGPFPWKDGAFDTIACLDTLEHMPADVRGPFVAELARVAARRVFVSCPLAEAGDLDTMFRQMYEAAGLDAPDWLDEHAEHGLPTGAEVAEACAHATGFRVEPWAQVNGVLSTLAVVADVHPELAAKGATEYRDHHDQWLRMMRESRFGDSYRVGFVLTREAPLTPTVTVDDFASTVVRALRCPACSETRLERTETGLRCSACTLELVPDETGAYDLRPTSSPPAPKRSRLPWRR
ncbi:hypothetical protein C8N24_2749 [Solirubrobacter pauli]|uniref:Methyltransferase family protein n=1 Tax=Solirubrobacter pauli TaxID=166793 RepID=A0A660LGD6_9ACTN|nr:hypothetical protein [Solirubrobacter pauli]RKQ92893.1 hypothetical protein C8N24_2749 [Solirubrobacter pauli]